MRFGHASDHHKPRAAFGLLGVFFLWISEGKRCFYRIVAVMRLNLRRFRAKLTAYPN